MDLHVDRDVRVPEHMQLGLEAPHLPLQRVRADHLQSMKTVWGTHERFQSLCRHAVISKRRFRPTLVSDGSIKNLFSGQSSCQHDNDHAQAMEIRSVGYTARANGFTGDPSLTTRGT